MRTTLLLLCILSITIGAKAQFLSFEWGHPGYYYDLNNVKHVGIIHWSAPYELKGDDHINFKVSKKAVITTIKSSDIQSFILQFENDTQDSFIVAKNNLFKSGPFIRVTKCAGNLKLYKYSITQRHTLSSPNAFGYGATPRYYEVNTYYFGDDDDHITLINKKTFVDNIARLMVDKPDPVDRVKHKKLNYNNIEDLIYLYKYDVLPHAQAPDPFSGSNN
jgi:hypothetical protein